MQLLILKAFSKVRPKPKSFSLTYVTRSSASRRTHIAGWQSGSSGRMLALAIVRH
jgi:hypothetical protein